MSSSDFLSASPDYIDALYRRFQEDPDTIPADWTAFFAGFELGQRRLELAPAQDGQGVYGLVNRYRNLGFRIADIDPLGHHARQHPLLELQEFGLESTDPAQQVGAGSFLGETDGTLGDLLSKLRETYCGPISVELGAITDAEQRSWLLQRMEPSYNRTELNVDERLAVLRILLQAEGFERFLGTKYLGQKRFSVEGAESLLVLLDTVLEHGSTSGVAELIIGMAHRGRLNVLAHTLNKPLEIIFSEFEGTALDEDSPWLSDVKYHLGYSGTHTARSGQQIYTSLMYNPSHLELIDPVIEGSVQARQDHRNDVNRKQSMPLVIHGEAAFTGQGIVPETLLLSELPGYHTGGTLHVIVNNQVGFTADPEQTRFTPYPTDVASMIQAPVFHVNADYPEAVLHAARVALEFRQEFAVDVLIDLWCYRRHGHNESDDPSFTQPLMYKQIAKHSPVTKLYAQRLIDGGLITAEQVEDIEGEIRDALDEAHRIAQETRPEEPKLTLAGRWQDFSSEYEEAEGTTGVAAETLQQITRVATEVPEGFHLHRKLGRLLESRREMVAGTRPVDWGMAEALAFGSLLLDGFPVRLTGEDSQRGTFSHRHAVWHDTEDGSHYVPLAHLPTDAPLEIRNTMLSELAVVGFEYGLSTVDPNRLVLWEAQFGDFINGAQSIIDLFLASGESKWLRMSGLVLLLPHGYEGQGPEHSSARVERFLQLCAQDNMQVCYPSTAAQYFHVLRRQMQRKVRKPLIVLTPKSMLRAEEASSPIEAFTAGAFQLVIDHGPGGGAEHQAQESAATRSGNGAGKPDARKSKDGANGRGTAAAVRRVLLCSGKIAHELRAAAAEREARDVALVAVEQLYPFAEPELRSVLERYGDATEVCWIQEEPQNMGAWSFMAPRLQQLLGSERRLGYAGRPEAATPASGSHAMHVRQQQMIIDRALDAAPVPAAYG